MESKNRLIKDVLIVSLAHDVLTFAEKVANDNNILARDLILTVVWLSWDSPCTVSINGNGTDKEKAPIVQVKNGTNLTENTNDDQEKHFAEELSSKDGNIIQRQCTEIKKPVLVKLSDVVDRPTYADSFKKFAESSTDNDGPGSSYSNNVPIVIDMNDYKTFVGKNGQTLDNRNNHTHSINKIQSHNSGNSKKFEENELQVDLVTHLYNEESVQEINVKLPSLCESNMACNNITRIAEAQLSVSNNTTEIIHVYHDDANCKCKEDDDANQRNHESNAVCRNPRGNVKKTETVLNTFIKSDVDKHFDDFAHTYVTVNDNPDYFDMDCENIDEHNSDDDHYKELSLVNRTQTARGNAHKYTRKQYDSPKDQKPSQDVTIISDDENDGDKRDSSILNKYRNRLENNLSAKIPNSGKKVQSGTGEEFQTVQCDKKSIDSGNRKIAVNITKAGTSNNGQEMSSNGMPRYSLSDLGHSPAHSLHKGGGVNQKSKETQAFNNNTTHLMPSLSNESIFVSSGLMHGCIPSLLPLNDVQSISNAIMTRYADTSVTNTSLTNPQLLSRRDSFAHAVSEDMPEFLASNSENKMMYASPSHYNEYLWNQPGSSFEDETVERSPPSKRRLLDFDKKWHMQPKYSLEQEKYIALPGGIDSSFVEADGKRQKKVMLEPGAYGEGKWWVPGHYTSISHYSSVPSVGIESVDSSYMYNVEDYYTLAQPPGNFAQVDSFETDNKYRGMKDVKIRGRGRRRGSTQKPGRGIRKRGRGLKGMQRILSSVSGRRCVTSSTRGRGGIRGRGSRGGKQKVKNKISNTLTETDTMSFNSAKKIISEEKGNRKKIGFFSLKKVNVARTNFAIHGTRGRHPKEGTDASTSKIKKYKSKLNNPAVESSPHDIQGLNINLFKSKSPGRGSRGCRGASNARRGYGPRSMRGTRGRRKGTIISDVKD